MLKCWSTCQVRKSLHHFPLQSHTFHNAMHLHSLIYSTESETSSAYTLFATTISTLNNLRPWVDHSHETRKLSQFFCVDHSPNGEVIHAGVHRIAAQFLVVFVGAMGHMPHTLELQQERKNKNKNWELTLLPHAREAKSCIRNLRLKRSTTIHR